MSQLNYENDYCIKHCIRFLLNCKALDKEETVEYTILFYHQWDSHINEDTVHFREEKEDEKFLTLVTCMCYIVLSFQSVLIVHWMISSWRSVTVASPYLKPKCSLWCQTDDKHRPTNWPTDLLIKVNVCYYHFVK